MRWVASVLVFLLQAPLPPAYPRPGATKQFENNRVVVWDIAWLKQQYPLHRHIYDLAGVYYSPGDRMIVSTDGTRRPVSTKAWDTAFQLRGVTHVEEGTSDVPLRAVFVEMKEGAPSGQMAQATTSPAFPQGGATQFLDNERVTAWELTPQVAPAPHRHLRDAVVMSFTGSVPHVSFVPQGTSHADDGTGSADRAYVYELK